MTMAGQGRIAGQLLREGGRFGRRTAADLFNERDVDDQVIALGTIG
jgi:hypothetical protein